MNSSLAQRIARRCLVIAFCFGGSPSDADDHGSHSIRPVSFDRVTLEDSFWAPRLRRQRLVLVPHAFEQTQDALQSLVAAGEILSGRQPAVMPDAHRYRTSDLFKVVEGAAYLLAIERDPQLERQIDRVVDATAAAQHADGYINATRTLYPNEPLHMMGDGPYTYVDHSHELYIMGHMYEAAVAYFRATGKRKLLDVAAKNAKHVRRVFFEGDPAYNDGKPILRAPGHQEIELALVRLADATGDATHADTARRFLDIRGVTYRPSGEGVNSPSYAQQHAAVADQREPAGHAVRAMYLYAGMADVDAKFGAGLYAEALDSIWRNIVDTRMHITGGLGAVHGIEGFGQEYQLPNADAFDETCAGVGSVLFNWRMFLLRQDAKFLDVAEVALYNNVLAGVNLEGDRFFYENPLATNGYRAFNHGHKERASWFGTACCPSNLARLLPQVPGMLFAVDDQELVLCLYASASTRLTLGGVPTGVTERTGYPYDGAVDLTLSPEQPARFKVRLRVPTWVGDRFVPGELYRSAEPKQHGNVRLLVNGEPVDAVVENGFLSIERQWSKGDTVRLELPMPVRLNRCREEVEANVGRVAVTRGPLVYCLESADNPGQASAYYLPHPTLRLAASGVGQLELNDSSISTVSVAGERLTDKSTAEPTQITLIPYYAWCNRGEGSMAVWLPDNFETAQRHALVIDKDANRFKSVTATHTFSGDTLDALDDGILPRKSFDASIPRWTSWPHRGETQLVVLELAKPTDLRSVEVYWYDDSGGVQAPVSWYIQVARGGEWIDFPLYNTDSYGVALDQFNAVHPGEPVTAEKIRLRITPRADASVGITELVVRSNRQDD